MKIPNYNAFDGASRDTSWKEMVLLDPHGTAVAVASAVAAALGSIGATWFDRWSAAGTCHSSSAETSRSRPD